MAWLSHRVAVLRGFAVRFLRKGGRGKGKGMKVARGMQAKAGLLTWFLLDVCMHEMTNYEVHSF